MAASCKSHAYRQFAHSPSSTSLVALTVSLLLACGQAQGQDTDSSSTSSSSDADYGGLQEVTVTARKSEENLMTVPLAVTAITAQDIENQGIKGLTDISSIAPSFHFTNQTGGGSGRNDRSGRNLTFRGLSIAGGIMFIDGQPVTGANPPPIHEIERVEVLPGPQAAYFGRATFMGAINFVTKDPAREFKGRAVGEFGSWDTREGLLSVEGPVMGDRLRGRLSLSHRTQGSPYENAGDGQEFGRQRTTSVSGTLLFEPTDSLTMKLWVNAFRDKDGPPAQLAFNQSEFNCDLGGTRGLYFCGTLPDADDIDQSLISSNYEITPYIYDEIFGNRLGFVNVFDPTFYTEGGLRRDGVQGSLRIEYAFENGFTLSSLTSYHANKQQVIIDLLFRDGRQMPNPLYPTQPIPYQTWLLMSQNKSWDYSQELRLTSPQDKRLRGSIGFNYLRSDSRSTLYGVKWTGTASSGTPSWSAPRTPAIFGGFYYDITDNLTISAEGRYQKDKINDGQTGFATGFPRPQPTRNSAEFTSFAPRVILDWNYAPDSTAYILFSRGYRPGGFNTSLIGQPPSVLEQFLSVGLDETFDEERVDNYEIGWKSTFLNGRARATVAFYYDLWRDGQVSTSVPYRTELGQLNLLTITQNIGKVDLKGVEFEAGFRATQHLTLSGTASFNDSEIKVFTCGDCMAIYGSTDATGNRLAQAERIKFTLSADYTRPFSEKYDWFWRGDYTYRGPYFVDHGNVARVGEANLVNMRAGFRTDNYSIEAFVRNLLDDAPLSGYLGVDVSTSSTPNQLRIALPDRRMFGVRMAYDF